MCRDLHGVCGPSADFLFGVVWVAGEGYIWKRFADKGLCVNSIFDKAVVCFDGDIPWSFFEMGGQ